VNATAVNATAVNATQAAIAGSFRRRGLRCTSQRYAVLQHLLKHPCHPTVGEIHKSINLRDPRVSRATVYNSPQQPARFGGSRSGAGRQFALCPGAGSSGLVRILFIAGKGKVKWEK